MNITLLEVPSSQRFQAACDCWVVGLAPSGVLGAAAAELDKMGDGWLTRAVQRGDISSKKGDCSYLVTPWEQGPGAVLVVGTGARDAVDAAIAFELGGVSLRRLTDRTRNLVCIAVSDLVGNRFQREFVAGAIAASTGQDLYMSSPKTQVPVTLAFDGLNPETMQDGLTLGDAINLTRKLVNQPANHLYPETFAQAAADQGREFGFEVEIWGEERLDAERCHAMLAVGQASNHESKLVMMRYRGAGDDSPPIALVGKGVTFDSGGLSIKPSPSMVDMKCDMAGAATVLGVITALARLGVRKNVIGYCGLVENMIAGNALRLGDVIRTRSGKTIEILNTDAEGRVVLADVLNVALDAKPKAIIDLATLTGACLVALGTDISGLFTNHERLAERVQQAANDAGELVWPLPMHAFFNEQIRSKVADIKNTGDGRWAGATTAAKFLEQFVDNVPWVHLDIAGPAFAESSKPHRDAGATGAMVRTLVKFFEGSTI